MESLQGYLGLFFVILLLSSFVKVFTSLTILRYGIGLEGAGFGVVILAVSLALSLLVISPQLDKLGINAPFASAASVSNAELEKQFRPFLERHAQADVTARLNQAMLTSKSQELESKTRDFNLLVSSFLISQLKEAFQIGFMLLVPFLIVDLLVANVLAVLGVHSISQAVIALPFKILLFFLADGWTLISQKLLAGY